MSDDIVARSLGVTKPHPPDIVGRVRETWKPGAVLSIYCYACQEIRSLTASEKEAEGITTENRFKVVDNCSKCRQS